MTTTTVKTPALIACSGYKQLRSEASQVQQADIIGFVPGSPRESAMGCSFLRAFGFQLRHRITTTGALIFTKA